MDMAVQLKKYATLPYVYVNTGSIGRHHLLIASAKKDTKPASSYCFFVPMATATDNVVAQLNTLEVGMDSSVDLGYIPRLI
eukprot:13979160-Ditylum_brightwellii.AAC.1